MRDGWSREEVEAAVSDYFDMLNKELRGEAFNKTEHNRLLRQVLNNRPRGSVERKHQNISAILIALGCPYVDGYKPLGNYQHLLRTVVEDRLSNAGDLSQVVSTVVNADVSAVPSLEDILAIKVPPPTRDNHRPQVYERVNANQNSRRQNYLEQEARNQALGKSGECLILNFEHQRLWQAGQRGLADKIEHVSATRGDGLGYDIHSFDENGRDRLIEVKTTGFGSMTPFFASRNELSVSEEQSDTYHLYRVFSFRKSPKLFILDGALNKTCELEPVTFAATPW